MTLQPINIRALVGAPAATVAGYGRKTAGVVELLRLRDGAPVRYDVPDGWAIPPRSQGACTHQELQCAFDALVAARPRGALMARSSGLGELPGQNPTLVSGYDHADRAGSFRRFADNVEAVLDAGPDVGVLAMAMVGKLSRLKDGTRVLGFRSTSFVADTHSAFRSADMYIAAVHGLGTRAVEVDGGVIGLTVDRASGNVLSINNTSEAQLHKRCGSLGGWNLDQYAQCDMDFFDWGRGQIVSASLQALADSHDFSWSIIDQVDWCAERTMGHLAERGLNPFGNLSALCHLVSLLQYFSGDGSRQIEGAFPNRDRTAPVLYQLIDLPAERAETAPLRLAARHITASNVVGKGRFTGPLIYLPECSYAALEAIDKQYGAGGYILVLPSHTQEAVNATPHCRCRISKSALNPTAHAVALTRIRNAAHPDDQDLLAMRVDLDFRANRIAGIKPDEVHPWGIVYHEATMESNGEEMAVSLVPPEQLQRPWWLRALAQLAPGLAGKW